MDGWLIQNLAGGAPCFYSARVGRDMGAASNGWVGPEQKEKALAFLRKSDAEDFLDIFLPHQRPFCEAVHA